VSAWDMFRAWPLDVVTFFKAYERLIAVSREGSLDSGTYPGVAEGLRTIADAHEQLANINSSAMGARRLADLIESGEVGDLSGRLAQWLDMVRDEFERCLFLGLTTEEARLYMAPDLPEEVGDRFPAARQEIGYASRCLALDMPTASAFHSIRALEVVLGIIASELNVARGQNWHNALQQIEKELRTRRESQDPEVKAWERRWGEFYAEAAQHFMYLKKAQRNPTMHWSTETIDHRRARQLRQHTIELIEAVAERLSEDGLPIEPEPPSEQSPGDAQS